MSGSLTIRGAQLVLPGRVATGDLLIEDGVITQMGPSVADAAGEVIDAHGLACLPGVIDSHVHFGEPGRTRSEDLSSGSRAAVAGGVTAFLDMPDNIPPTTSNEALQNKLSAAAARSAAHFGFYIGATPDNLDELRLATRAAGVLVDMSAVLDGRPLFSELDLETLVAELRVPLVVNAAIATRPQERAQRLGPTDNPEIHGQIYDERCYEKGLQQILVLAERYGRQLHVLHVSTQAELALLRAHARPGLSAAVSPQHLFLAAEDAYHRMGCRALTTPPLRGKAHRLALWEGLSDGTIACVASAHKAHRVESKARPYPLAPSGMPSVEWMLPLLLDQVAAGRCTLPQVAHWLSESPAKLHRLPRKGRLEVGFDGDIVLIDTHRTRVVGETPVRTRCGWSPWEGRYLTGTPVLTAILGEPVFRDGQVIDGVLGQELLFSRSKEIP